MGRTYEDEIDYEGDRNKDPKDGLRQHWIQNCPRRKLKYTYRLKVKNLAKDTTRKELRCYMEKVGQVAYADVSRRSRNGFVDFTTHSSMQKALEVLNYTELRGRVIKLDRVYAKPSLSHGSPHVPSRAFTKSQSPTSKHSKRSKHRRERSKGGRPSAKSGQSGSRKSRFEEVRHEDKKKRSSGYKSHRPVRSPPSRVLTRYWDL